MIKGIKLDELSSANIGDWPWLIKASVIFLSGLLLFLGIYLSVLQEQFQTLNTFRIKGANLRQVLISQQQQLSQRTNYENQLKDLQKNWVNKTEHLPNEDQIADLLIDITKIGLVNKLQFKSIAPLPEQQQDILSIVPVEISVKGKHLQLANFLQQTMAFKQSLNLQSFSLFLIGEVPTLKLLINIYRDELLAANVNLPGVFALSTFAIDTLQMVGYLQQGNKQWGLLAAPNGNVYRVTVGMSVGQYHGRVTHIDRNKIEIVESTAAGFKNLVLQMHK